MIPTPDPRELQSLLDASGHRAWAEMALRYGKTFRVGPMVVTCEPHAVQSLLMDRAHTEQRPLAYRWMGKLPGAGGILFLDGAPWRNRARALAPPFRRRAVDSHADRVHAIAARHAERWRTPGRQPDLYDAVQQLGAEVVLAIGYGLDPEDPDALALAQALVAYKQKTMTPDPRQRIDTLVPRSDLATRILPVIWKMGVAHRRVRQAARRVLAARAPAERPANWLDALAVAGLRAGELATEVNHLYGAFNAIDYVTTCALCELARDGALVQALRTELAATCESRVPMREDLERMPLVRGFMLEILRRYPVSMSVNRQVGEPLVLGGETLPPGTQVGILLHALHHHPDFWSDPQAFDPRRWTGTAAPHVPHAYVPFLLGSRKCMGRDMAEQHLLVVVAAVIRRFRITLHAEPLVPTFLIPRFARPIPFSLEPA